MRTSQIQRVIRLTHEDIGWELTPDFEALFREVLASPARVVKESNAKLVSEHRVGGRSYYVKRYRHFAVPWRSFKFWFKPSQARQEWRLAQALESRGVPIVRHAALGERRSWRGVEESILITEAFDGLPANEVLSPALPAVVAFIETVWRAGVVQRDLHPANLLVNIQSQEMRLVDLHGIVLCTPPVKAGLEAMLAAARMALPIPVSPSIERLSVAMRKRALHARSRRCLRVNRDFAAKKFSAWTWNLRTAAVTPAIAQILHNPDAFLENAQSLKRGRSSTVGTSGGVVLKRYNFKKPLNLFKDVFRGSRGRRGFRKSYHLELCGINTPRVLATADFRVCGFPARSYVLMEEIADAVNAGDVDKQLRSPARALGQLLAQLHNEGFTHRDLKETNILFELSGRPYLIDLDGLEFVFDVRADDAAANLRRLAQGLAAVGQITRSQLIAFLLAYCRLRQVGPRKLFPRRK